MITSFCYEKIRLYNMLGSANRRVLRFRSDIENNFYIENVTHLVRKLISLVSSFVVNYVKQWYWGKKVNDFVFLIVI